MDDKSSVLVFLILGKICSVDCSLEVDLVLLELVLGSFSCNLHVFDNSVKHHNYRNYLTHYKAEEQRINIGNAIHYELLEEYSENDPGC